MARSRIQFQKGLSEAQFAHLYGDEEKCRALVISWRWPEGFVCPKCGGLEHCVTSKRRLFQCNACRRQTSPKPCVRRHPVSTAGVAAFRLPG